MTSPWGKFRWPAEVWQRTVPTMKTQPPVRRCPPALVFAAAVLWAAVLWGTLAAPCARAANPESTGEYGPSPAIPAPHTSVLPTLHVARATGWSAGNMPRAAQGTAVAAFATGLSHPRWLYVLPNGDVLVAEAEAPPKPDDAKGVGGEVHKWVMKHAGSGAAPSANRITLLRDSRVDGAPVERHIFLSGLNSPIGMALVGDTLYLANSDAVVRVPYHTGDTEIHTQPEKVSALPAGTQLSMKKIQVAMNLLSTMFESRTGAVSSTSSVPVRFSSLKVRIVSSGTRKTVWMAAKIVSVE